MGTVMEAITKRCSTRGYTTDEPGREEIGKIIEAGLKAPTAANMQEIHFSVLKGDNPVLKEIEDEKNRLRNITNAEQNFYYGAPIVVILSGKKDFNWSFLDAGIAVENMALAATEMGLGNLIIGCIYDAMHGEKEEQFSKAVGIPEGWEFEIAIAVGYQAVSKEPHTYDADKQVNYCF